MNLDKALILQLVNHVQKVIIVLPEVYSQLYAQF